MVLPLTPGLFGSKTVVMFSGEEFMYAAYKQALIAEKTGEVPVGAVVVRDGEVIGRGFNHTLTNNDPTAHAEIIALRDAADRTGNHRLTDADIYVTIEPCTMCAGALVHARIAKLYFAAREPRGGAIVSTLRALDNESLNHRVQYEEGLCSDICTQLISGFFRRKRP